MKVTTLEGSLERQTLLDLIASWEVADYAYSVFPEGPTMAGTPASRVLLRWLYAYHPVSDGVPYGDGGFRRDWETQGHEIPEEAKKTLSAFMETLGEDWKARGPKAVSKAKEDLHRFFTLSAAQAYAERVTRAAESGDVDTFSRVQGTYKAPGVEEKKPVNIFRDVERVHKSLTTVEDVLFRFPGAIGELLGPVIRGDFLAPLAREKMGKSWIVDYVAKTAVMQGCHVLIVDVEMVDDQKLRRLWRQLVGAPAVSGEFELPYFDRDGEIAFRKREFKGVSLDLEEMRRYAAGLRRLSGGGCLEVMSMPTRGCKVSQVDKLVQDHIKEYGKPYDLIVADSLDYFEPGNTRLDGIDKLFDIWSAFRGLGQKYNSAVMSPSHTGRKNKKGSGSEDDVAGNIQKLWMVTKTLFIEATKAEQEAGVLRMSTSTSRDNRMRDDSVVILQGLDIARPVLDSRWLSDVRSDLVFRGNQGKFGADLP